MKQERRKKKMLGRKQVSNNTDEKEKDENKKKIVTYIYVYIYGCIHQKSPAHPENFSDFDETFRVCGGLYADHFHNK